MNYADVKEQIDKAQNIVVLQADNPDGDSLGSALALEAIFFEMGKNVHLVCKVDMPAHLKYMPGWDRVVKDVPNNFDCTVVVDSSTESLFEDDTTQFSWIKARPVIVLDHHTESKGLSFADVSIIEDVVATSELIHKIAVELDWPLPLDACEMMAMSIMSDSLGLTTDATTSDSYRTMADLLDRGVIMAKLDAARRELMKKEPELIPYKGELLRRAQISSNGKIASVSIPWKEIEKYSPIYNPTMLVIDDLRMVVGVVIAIGYKIYSDGKITAKIRANYGTPIASELASKFGGGGHPYAAGFKILDGKDLDTLKKEVEAYANELIDNLDNQN